jgi:hypothetical protein
MEPAIVPLRAIMNPKTILDWVLIVLVIFFVLSFVLPKLGRLANLSWKMDLRYHVSAFNWIAIVVGFLIAWLWFVSRYPIWQADDGIFVLSVSIGLLILAIAADFVWSLFHKRRDGEPRQWYFLSPAGGSFTGRYIIGGLLLGLCVVGSILFSDMIRFDLNWLNHPPPIQYLPYIKFFGIGAGFLTFGVGIALSVFFGTRRKMAQHRDGELPQPVSARSKVSFVRVLFSQAGAVYFLGGLAIAIVVAVTMGDHTLAKLFGSLFIILMVCWKWYQLWQAAKTEEVHGSKVAPLAAVPKPAQTFEHCVTCAKMIPIGSPQGLCPRCLMRGIMPSQNATKTRNVRPIEPPPPAEINSFFPRLEVSELIGVGGMGAVYRAKQPTLDRFVALKIVQSPTGDDDPIFAERFAREARAMAKLDHPNIVTIYESGEAGGLPYLLMEFVDGITLREAMESKVLTTAEALAVIPQICDALDFAHKHGVVHRDIKPENILIDQSGRVKIADFGLAKLADPKNITLTRTQQAMGTPHYMAPEQWEKPNEVDHRADIYALGVVLYELLTGELPLGRFDLPSAKGKGNTGLDQVVLRALAKEPGQRYQHASEMKTALSGLENE